ncbi:hypothetical protein PRIPAC_76157 [Pristionchus pacificus]|uniref:Uncharacterized protein n=1 Tax=Pristionchus pacificus TaxID=54126 RepID=A0A2A6C182_PRIPA|nr:hypothetical protein PRIPAC_76157 [Pristionchus pacificus]|eukprot:PDM71934.1 hypothetical protein PRIPAC_38341 [Pristionchus pacificus]
MVKVRFERKQYDAMTKFEKQHHPDIWKFVMDKIGRSENLSLLDVSDEASVFALNLADNYPTNKLTCALRGSPPAFPLPANVTCKKVDFRNNFNDVVGLGEFDAVIANELTHEISDLGAFFAVLKTLLKPGAPIIVITRPKNPPIPIPEMCLPLWRNLAPSKEEFLAAANKAELNSTSFSAAVPITVDRQQWEEILYSGCFPAVRNTPKCGEQEIRQWINGKSGKIAFEEKLTIFLFRA